MRRARARSAIVAAAVVAAYLAAAALSGHLSVTARRPMLDGFVTTVPYNWVNPPPAQAASNKQPASGSATLLMTPKGSNAAFVSTTDAQCELILGISAFPRSPGQTGVVVTIRPLDPATLGPAPTGLVITGNAYEVRASYAPGGAVLRDAQRTFTAKLVYPAMPSAGLFPPAHTVLVSGDGKTWTRFKTIDTHAALTATISTRTLGYFVVAAPPSAALPAGSSNRAVVLLVIAGIAVVAIVGLVLLVRARRARA